MYLEYNYYNCYDFVLDRIDAPNFYREINLNNSHVTYSFQDDITMNSKKTNHKWLVFLYDLQIYINSDIIKKIGGI